MSYWITKTQNASSTENFGLGAGASAKGGGEFYELEPAIVLDIILNKEHPLFQLPKNLQTSLDIDRWPADLNGKKALQGEIDYSWIGRALLRLQFSTPTTQKERLIWAYPMESCVSEYPLVNEIVMVFKYRNQYFYTRKLNLRNLPNESVDFAVNTTISNTPNNELYTNKPFEGRISQTNVEGSVGYKGIAGKYYKINSNIRKIKRYEGDFVLESRFGQSIRFGAYDDKRENDQGDATNSEYNDFGGNPMIIIRNRQRKLLKVGEELKLNNSPNPATIIGSSEEKNAGGYIKEDINHDGTSIYITTGQTISNWVSTCHKKMFGVGEEVSSFNGDTSFTYPSLNGDQLVLNTNRIILSSRYGETFHYSKKRYAIVTDSEYTVDAHQQIVITTNTKTVINSPAIYLGEYNVADEPVLLGQTTVNWLYELCNWLADHVHWYIHSHVDAGSESPSQTQASVQAQRLIALRDTLKKCLSRRVFVTGGGFAPGKDGGSIPDGTTPLQINVGNGNGVPGGWKGANKR